MILQADSHDVSLVKSIIVQNRASVLFKAAVGSSSNSSSRNLSFRARQHLWLLASVMNDFFMIMIAIDIRGWLGPKVS